MSDPATRPWRIAAYNERAQTAKPVYQSAVRGDANLDDAVKPLEANPAIVRIRVEPA